MIEKQIQELSLLTGPDYAARRNAFLDQAPPLPDYPHDLMARGPEYRAQYLILQGWQRNAALLGEIGKRVDAVNARFMAEVLRDFPRSGTRRAFFRPRHGAATGWPMPGRMF